MEQIAEKVLQADFTRVALIDVRSGLATTYRRSSILPQQAQGGERHEGAGQPIAYPDPAGRTPAPRAGGARAVLPVIDPARRLDQSPSHPGPDLSRELLDPAQATTAGARSWADLPAQAIKYVRRIEELIRCPVALVSTSPERDDTILVRDPFAG